MSKIQKYVIVAGWSADEAQKRIQDFIDVGWVPWGGMALLNDLKSGLVFVQPMVFYDEYPLAIPPTIEEMEAARFRAGYVAKDL